jgi:lysophospholipase L1-like esterase
MSESNNNTPMRITQLEEAETFDYESYLPEAKAGSGTKKVKGSTLLAELINIRQGADGATYPNAGDAVRGQITTLQKLYDITLNDFTLTGGTTGDGTTRENRSRFLYLYNGKYYMWAKTPFIKVYSGQKLKLLYPCHIRYFSDLGEENLISKVSENVGVVTIASGVNYIEMSYLVLPSEDFTKIIGQLYIPKYSKKDLFVNPKVATQYIGLENNHKYYKSNGLYAYGSDTLVRGVAYPYEGDILYNDVPTNNNIYPFAIKANVDYYFNAGFMGLEIVRGTDTGNLYIMEGSSDFSRIPLTFSRSFEGNINGVKVTIESNILTVSYIYEGEIKTNTATVEDMWQLLYDHCTHVTGCLIQTGTTPNIAYYGRGLTTYEDYYRLVKDLTDDTQIASNTNRIEALEESGGGGGGTPSLDWAKGYDLLSFGQEYLYAWLNSLNNGNAFKVLFTGDSTTAYYDGTTNGLKEIYKSCMEKAGYTNGTYVNRGVSGINAATWVSNYLAGDIAENPTLYIIRHGFNNNAGSTEDEIAESFRLSMIEALTTIRNSLSVNNTSIILMTPNTSDDNPNNRGYSMKKKLDPIIRQLARDYGCGFIDIFRIFYDAGIYADPMYDDPFGDHRSIHPNGLMNRLIISRLFEFACPYAYRDN